MSVCLSVCLSGKFSYFFLFQVNELYRYDLIYDGKRVASILEPNNRVLSVDESYSPLTGKIRMLS